MVLRSALGLLGRMLSVPIAAPRHRGRCEKEAVPDPPTMASPGLQILVLPPAGEVLDDRKLPR